MRKDVIRQGRLGDSRDSGTQRFLSSMKADREIAGADLLVDLAHLLMLERQGLIDRPAAGRLLNVLTGLVENGIPDSAFEDRFEDIHAGVEALLVERAGEDAGGRLHTGRSRNDEVATCIRIRLREELLLLMEALLDLRGVLARLASSHGATIMPGFTHLQYAQPTTLAHHLLAYEQAFSRDSDRLSAAFSRVNRSPLGAAAFAGTGYRIDREWTAGALGFDGLVTNTMDAVASRDFAAEVVADCAIVMSTASRLCEELVVWSSPFARFVELDDSHASTSSIMPQKKNPDTAEIMRAKAGTVAGDLAAILMITKGLPMSYNRDLQELTPRIWEAVSSTAASIVLLSAMLGKAKFDTGRMEEEAAGGGSTATDLADHLVTRYGLPFRTAHAVVARAVRDGEITLASLDRASGELGAGSLSARGLSGQEIAGALDPVRSVMARDLPGGPAPAVTGPAAADRSAAIGAERAALREVRDRLDASKERLLSRARELAS